MMYRSTKNDKEDSGSDWDDYSPEATPVARPSLAKSPESGSLKQAKKTPASPVEVQNVRAPRKGNVEIEFTSITALEQEASPDSSRLQSARPAYRVASEQGTQTEQVVQDAPSTAAASARDDDDDRRSAAGPDIRLTLPRTGSMFSFVTLREDDNHYLILDHDTVESVMGTIATRSEKRYRRCAAEVFATLRIVSDCLIIFMLECLFYTAHHVLYKAFCGASTTLLDAICKPCVPAFFNSALWPLCLLIWKLNTSIKLCLRPCVELMGMVVGHCVSLAKACRLVEVNKCKTEQV